MPSLIAVAVVLIVVAGVWIYNQLIRGRNRVDNVCSESLRWPKIIRTSRRTKIFSICKTT